MTDVYLHVGFAALIVAMLAVLIFSVQSLKLGNRRVMGELAEMRRLLERELLTLREAQQEPVRDKRTIGSPGRPEAAPRNSELETLRLLVLRQDEEIRTLQKEAEMIQQSLAGLNSAAGLMESADALSRAQGQRGTRGDQVQKSKGAVVDSQMVMGEASPRAFFGKDLELSKYEVTSATPFYGAKERRGESIEERSQEAGWKENLEGILSMLDAMEREVQN